MPSSTFGGPSSDVKYGFELTVEPPANISTVAIAQGDLFKLGGAAGDGSGYKAADAVAADVPSGVILLMAKHAIPAGDVNTPLGVKVLGHGAAFVCTLGYTGTAPTVGQSVAISATNVRKVVAKAFAKGDGIVLKVFTATSQVEVLFN